MEAESNGTASRESKPKLWKISFAHHIGLGICALIVLFAIGLLLMKYGHTPVPQPIRESSLYQQILTKVKASPSIVKALGEPVDSGRSFKGSIEEGEQVGYAKFNVFFTGSKNSGTLYVEGRKAKGEWSFEILELSPDRDAATICNLLLEAEAPAAAPANAEAPKPEAAAKPAEPAAN